MSIETQISNTLNDFAFKLYQHLTKENKNGNFFISPHSISTALTMCYLGAKNETAEQLKLLLSLEELSDEQILELNKTYQSTLAKLHDEIAFKTANKIYSNLDTTIKTDFNNLLTETFSSEANELDFAESKQSADTINQWVAENTENKISSLIDEDSLSSDTKLVLVNAIYFKGSWQNKFDPSQTIQDDFYLEDETVEKVEMMRLNEKFVVKLSPGGIKANALVLPYVGKSILMTIVLPHEGVKLNEIEDGLNHFVLSEILFHYPFKRKVNGCLPKFKIEFKTELSECLENLGAKLAFDELKADFSGISDTRLSISKVIHQAVVEVNEEGTEAAAANAVNMTFRSTSIPQPPIEFKCNRPFLFIIHDNENNGVLFMGKYAKPL